MLPEHLQEAREDLAAADLLLQGPPMVPSALFHSQQAGEKALKVYLTFHQRDYPRTHDVGQLLDLCAAVDPDFTALERLADSLTPFAVDVRYIRMYPGLSREFALQILENARQIVAFVENRLPSEVTR